MKPIVPPQDLPDTVRAVLFKAPAGAEEEVNDLPGLVHMNDQGEAIACEFMFEFTKEEIQVLRHEPYLTLTMMVQAPPVFALQTTFEPDEKYKTLMEHSHVCTENLAHEKQMFWKCDNPAHDSTTTTRRTCAGCFDVANAQAVEEE